MTEKDRIECQPQLEWMEDTMTIYTLSGTAIRIIKRPKKYYVVYDGEKKLSYATSIKRAKNGVESYVTTGRFDPCYKGRARCD